MNPRYVALLAFVRWILSGALEKAHFQELGKQILMQQRPEGLRKEKGPLRSVVLFGRWREMLRNVCAGQLQPGCPSENVFMLSAADWCRRGVVLQVPNCRWIHHSCSVGINTFKSVYIYMVVKLIYVHVY